MKVLIGCDVDPILPPLLDHKPSYNIWSPLELIPDLLASLGDDLPPITWLIRSDESIQYCTEDFASGYISKQKLWRSLQEKGHELGWHMHLISHDSEQDFFYFDPEPDWLFDSYQALNQFFTVQTTRTGWDYGSNSLFQSFDKLGIKVDFSALPESRVYWQVAGDRFVSDWISTPTQPYHPCKKDYRMMGKDPLKILEVPITQFRNPFIGRMKRAIWHIYHGYFNRRAFIYKTKKITQHWDLLPETPSNVFAFFFHPEELTHEGIECFCNNLKLLRSIPNVKFITASSVLEI